MSNDGWGRLIGPYAASRLAGQAMEYAGWVVLARRLEPEAFGELAVVFLLCRYGGLVADWGASIRGPRDAAGVADGAALRALADWRRKVTVALLIVISLGLLATGTAELLPVAAVAAALGLSRDWVALGQEQPLRAGSPVLLQGFVLLGGSLFVSALPGAAAVVGAAYAAGLGLSLALNRLGGAGGASPAPRPDGWILVAVLSVQVTTSFDTVLLSVLRSPEEAGIYAAVYRIPNAWYAVLTVVLAVLIPRASRAAVAGQETFAALRRSWLRVSAPVSLCVLLLAPVAALAVPVVYGDDYRDGVGPVAVLMVAHAVLTLFAPLSPLAVALVNDRAYTLVMLGAAGANTLMNLVVIPAFGTVGAAWSTLGTQVLLGLALLWLTTWGAHPGWSHPSDPVPS